MKEYFCKVKIENSSTTYIIHEILLHLFKKKIKKGHSSCQNQNY